MKKLFMLICLLAFVAVADAQIKGVLDRMKQRAIEKKNQKVNTAADNAVDSAFSKTEKTMKDAAKEITTKDTTKKSNDDGDELSEGNTEKKATALKAYSKYDFVPGEKIIVFEDFDQDAIGDFPAKWNTNASGEIMTVEGKTGHWFAMKKVGFFMPEFIDSLPEDFTLEFDMLVSDHAHSWGLYASLIELQDHNNPENWHSATNSFSLNILPGDPQYNNSSSTYQRMKNGAYESGTPTKITQFEDISKPVHIAFWRQKERLRVYLNEEKTWDLPKVIQPGAKLNSLIFSIQNIGPWFYLISNIRLAVGAPDTRKKILEQSKWVTHGILFDVNSDRIKPESYGTLKEMANVLKEYTDLRVMIVGHTDADGSDANNLDLSKRRAEAVKIALAKEFKIEESRMETDGKGESEPIDINTTPAGKANNRRVEFIKL